MFKWIKRAVLALAFGLALAMVPQTGAQALTAFEWSNGRYSHLPEIRYGSRGDVVRLWQSIVWHQFSPQIGWGNCGNFTDGQFGPNTKRWSIEMQKVLFPGQSWEWNGSVGPKTWHKAFYYMTGYGSNYWNTYIRGETDYSSWTYPVHRRQNFSRNGMTLTYHETYRQTYGFAPDDARGASNWAVHGWTYQKCYQNVDIWF